MRTSPYPCLARHTNIMRGNQEAVVVHIDASLFNLILFAASDNVVAHGDMEFLDAIKVVEDKLVKACRILKEE